MAARAAKCEELELVLRGLWTFTPAMPGDPLELLVPDESLLFQASSKLQALYDEVTCRPQNWAKETRKERFPSKIPCTSLGRGYKGPQSNP